MLREGIYHATNPHPKSGAYLFPEQVERHCVKVFIPGLVRSDRAYIGRVVATVRAFRDHEASLTRLRAMEDEQRAGAGAPGPPVRLSPVLEWWTENFALVRDVSIRRYPVHMQSYDGLLRDPVRVVHETVTWLGGGDALRGCQQVKPERRTFQRTPSTSVEPEVAEVFDELYEAVDNARRLSPAFLAKLNETNARLLPRIRDERARVSADVAARRAKRAAGGHTGRTLGAGRP